MPKRLSKKQRSSFQKKTLRTVRGIHKGKFLTYKEVARLVGKPRAWRAVGNILNKNRDPKIPCHRVIRSDGKVGGYRYGTNKKVALLKNEGITINYYGKVTS